MTVADHHTIESLHKLVCRFVGEERAGQLICMQFEKDDTGPSDDARMYLYRTLDLAGLTGEWHGARCSDEARLPAGAKLAEDWTPISWALRAEDPNLMAVNEAADKFVKRVLRDVGGQVAAESRRSYVIGLVMTALDNIPKATDDEMVFEGWSPQDLL